MELRQIEFKSNGIEIAGILRVPPGLCANVQCPAIILVTPGSSVKEQIGGIYASKLALRGFITLTFDPSYQGQSGGEPRDLEDPASRIEDVRSAVDFLMTQASVSEKQIGVLGICAGGGYAVATAKTEPRLKAIATVVPVNIGRARRQGTGGRSFREMLDTVGDQRTLEARGGDQRRDKWIPDSHDEAQTAGLTDPDLFDAIDFYRTARGFNQHSTNRIYFASLGRMIDFDAFHLVAELLWQPLEVIVGGRFGTTQSFSDGKLLFERAPNRRAFHVIAGAGHYDLYDKDAYVDQAIEKLESFFKAYLVK